jgi:SAM-dependent methyltransferase
MTFFIKRDGVQPKAGVFADLALSQRARAGMDILGSMQVYSSSVLRDAWKAKFDQDADGAALNAEPARELDHGALRDRIARSREVAQRDPIYFLERFVQRYVAEENFVRGIPAVEERRAAFEAFGKPPAEGGAGGTLDLDPGFEPPAYTHTEWHLEPGGWEGYDLYPAMFAYAVGPRVFSRGGYAYAAVGEDIRKQRMDFVAQFPRRDYGRILELGCGACTTLLTVARAYPAAEMVGVDTSTTLLKTGHANAELQGVKVALKRASADAVPEPDASFDLVYSYALHHEIPPKTSRKVLEEAFRTLKPGGDFVMSDLPPHREVDPFHSLLLDWETKNRGEPFFTPSALMNLDEAMREIGFTDVESFGLGEHRYPWITRGRKPA